MRHVVFHRSQILALYETLMEFEDILGVCYQFEIQDDGSADHPLRIEYLWGDEE